MYKQTKIVNSPIHNTVGLLHFWLSLPLVHVATYCLVTGIRPEMLPFSVIVCAQNVIRLSCLFSERELVLEIDRLKHRNGNARKRGKSPNRLEIFVKG